MSKLTKKQKGFVKDYIKTGNGTQSALNNYDIDSDKPEKVASVIATENLAKPSIINAIKSIADRIPDELLEKVHLEGLEASDKVVKQGEVFDIPDYQTRHKYLDSAYKLKGLYAPEKSINLDIQADITNPQARELAKKYEDELKQSLENASIKNINS
jgi:hypothetical protein